MRLLKSIVKGSEAQKQRPDKLLWMLWFDEKSILSLAAKLGSLAAGKDPYYTTRTLPSSSCTDILAQKL